MSSTSQPGQNHNNPIAVRPTGMNVPCKGIPEVNHQKKRRGFIPLTGVLLCFFTGNPHKLSSRILERVRALTGMARWQFNNPRALLSEFVFNKEGAQKKFLNHRAE